MRSYIFAASFVASAVVIAACSQSNFAGGGQSNKPQGVNQIPKSGAPTPTPIGGGGGGTPSPAPTLSSSQGIVPLNESVKCSEGLVQIITGTQSCPANSTAFAADDGSGAAFACCALPKTDILVQTIPTSVRGGECQEDELVVGVTGNSVVCQKIDTTKYKLANPGKACYYGNGAAGSSGAGPCGAPNKLLNALGARFGVDGCITSPGNIVHGRNGRDCGDIPIRALQNIDGTPVAFPY